MLLNRLHEWYLRSKICTRRSLRNTSAYRPFRHRKDQTRTVWHETGVILVRGLYSMSNVAFFWSTAPVVVTQIR